jgi:hypothetical protein
MMKKITACFLGLMVASMAHAAKEDESKPPLGCRNQGYQFKLDVLDLIPDIGGDNQSLYFVFNQLNQPISLYQMLGDNSTRSTYLNHTVAARQWSILATNQNALRFVCTTPDKASRYGRVVNCSESVTVCEYARVKFGLNNRGNYWFLNSNTRNGAVRDVGHYGIIPR